MPTGTIKNFFEDKGFGFITPDDGGEDVFVHRKLHGDGQDRTAYLSQGDAVTYEVEWDDRRSKFNASSCIGPWKTGGGGGGGGWGGGGKGGGDWGGKGGWGGGGKGGGWGPY
ncbi:unnamed protein product [Prorocentrum cordatum]|uniref:CSD domain-containing protein n=1 Tax=Prorocentrum cordatum TaxID=2364126 RepID=A0ABN9VIT5_9DINO|nr:unnamed protein product [Polarella glacialis]|mmetsp:Transcript_92514/g.244517  ORF Transcript_92514/g.244517 Transcript_92514/m.244517 type:complete len:112 (-) Transcript_92514:87-422(-)